MHQGAGFLQMRKRAKFTRNRRIFPGDDAALKGLFVAIREASKNWNPIQFWRPALQSFQIMFGEERVPWNVI
jgi:transposase-like protein